MGRKKKKALGPRVKRMNRSARLQSARHWLPTYEGKSTAAGYRKHFGVDWNCAFKELEILGVKIDSGYKNRLLQSVAGHNEARRRRKIQRKAAQEMPFEQDANFAYIAGYTAGGFAYGVTWEEWDNSTVGTHSIPESEIEMVAEAEDQAGYGYGITWDEWEELGSWNLVDPESETDAEDIPF